MEHVERICGSLIDTFLLATFLFFLTFLGCLVFCVVKDLTITIKRWWKGRKAAKMKRWKLRLWWPELYQSPTVTYRDSVERPYLKVDGEYTYLCWDDNKAECAGRGIAVKLEVEDLGWLKNQ